MTETFERRPKTGGEYRPLGRGELLDHDDRSLRVKTGATTVEVTALAPDLFRVGMFPEGRPPRYDSEAIAREDWEPVEAPARHDLTPESFDGVDASPVRCLATASTVWASASAAACVEIRVASAAAFSSVSCRAACAALIRLSRWPSARVRAW